MTSPYSDRAAAEIYRVVTGPVQFGPPAADLVAMLGPAAGMRILDVGTGTGIVAEHIGKSVSFAAFIVGVDAAIPMLRQGRLALAYPIVGARLPDLPFAAGTFDQASAGFVISHLADYGAALKEIARVCRPGARIGITVWGSLPNPAAQLWTETASRLVPRVEFDRAVRAHLPWDEWFSDPGRVRQALDAAGLQDVIVETRTYRLRMRTSDFLAARGASIQGSVMRELLSHEQGEAFRLEVTAAFEARFGAELEYDRDVHFGLARKP